MGELLEVALKENICKVGEKSKELKHTLERTDITEVLEIRKIVVQEADVETVINSSLASLIEKNKERREAYENKSIETNEQNKEREGLTNEKKEKIREIIGWSDEILDAIGSWEEAKIYIKAGLKEVEMNGKKCLIREDINLEQKDEDGITNYDRMKRGRPPITEDGEEVELHHIGQKQTSPLAELTMEQHRGVGNDTVLHDKTKETEINRNEFGKERREYWKDRVESMEGEG